MKEDETLDVITYRKIGDRLGSTLDIVGIEYRFVGICHGVMVRSRAQTGTVTVGGAPDVQYDRGCQSATGHDIVALEQAYPAES